LYAQWNKVGQFDGERGTCGFFWDEMNGLIGFGNGLFNSGINALILRTTDGGKTWVTSNIPSTPGDISSIYMKDRLVGYASVYESTNPPRTYSIWKTTDGGVTWQDHTFTNAAITTCVYATSKALIRTTWFDGNIGGRSLDDGLTFTSTFSNPNGNDRSNGIDFSDDLNGIVTMGPPNRRNTTWLTQDGGVTWNSGGVIPEAWSVYALKGTKTFFVMPEGQSLVWNWNLFRSDDAGFTWNAGFTFPFNERFTGNIAGGSSTLYVQTSSANPNGLYRSDDLGQTWKNIGGPSNDRDTRFAVTGCNTEVVYAFDASGGVWKTINGGDGTLHGAAGNGTLSFSPPTLSLSSICESPTRGYLTFSNFNCDSISIDSISISPNPNGEFSIDTVKSSFNLFSSSTVGVPILFQSDSDVTRNAIIHIHAHSTNKVIDTTIVVLAQHSTVSGPILSLPFDSVYMETRYCQPLRSLITITNRNCDSLIIDTAMMNPQYPEFIIDTSQAPKLALQKNSSGTVPVFFQTNLNLTRQTSLHIIAHSLDRKIDTTIILVAKHSTAPEPLLVTPPTAKIGDQVLIPVYLKPTQDSFTITHFTFHLSYDGDVLTLASPYPYEVNSTLSSIGKVTMGPQETNGALCTVDFSSPITETSNLTLPLIYLRMQVYLSRYLYSAIRLDTFSISNTAPLPLCTIPETMFLVDPLCGDSTIAKYMLNGTVPGFLSVYPNPNSGNPIEAEIYVPNENTLTLEIIDEAGKNIQTVFDRKYFVKGKHILPINTFSLLSGKYILRMRTSDGGSFQQEIITLR
jgi:hypothetical protein